MLNALMAHAYLTVTSISASTNTMDMLNVSMENVFQTVTNTNVLRNMANVSKEYVYQHVINTNARLVVVNVSKVFARRNAVVELLVQMQFTLELKIHTMLTIALPLVLIWEKEYSKFLSSFENTSWFQSNTLQTFCKLLFFHQIIFCEQIAHIMCYL